MISKIPLCPHCYSADTTFKTKANLWECNQCERRFEDPSVSKRDPQTIFLSYAHKSEKEQDYDISEDLVLLVKAALEQDGHTVWIDKEGIRGGHNWRENITRAILSHDHFLSFLSKRSVRDPGVCLNEIAIALDKGVSFQTVLTEPEEIVKPPITVTDTQWHQFVGWEEVRSQGQSAWDAWFEERMKGVREQIQDAKNARAPGELTVLRRALAPTTFYQDIAKKTEGFFGRKWLFDAFDQWLDKTNDQIFWLQGSPGIGKSAFAAKLVHQSNSRIIGFFKCDFQSLKNPEESAKEVICTLAYQLATRMPDYRAKLLYGQGVNDPEVVLKKTADDLFKFLITEPLNKQGKIVEGQRSAIVIDALDEAGRNDGTNPLLILIKKHAPNLPDWLGIVITSRPEGYIVQELADIKAQSVSGDTTQNMLDLKDYLDKQLDLKIAGDERVKIINQIIAKSDGAFLYISQIIKDKYDLTKPELLPDGMNGYFMENFSRYFKDAKEYGKETEPFLELMVAAPGPLPKGLGQKLLGWTDREVTIQVTEPMGSLLQEKDGGLIFFHKSLSEWLQDHKRSGRYHVNPKGSKKLGEFLWIKFEGGRTKEEKESKEEGSGHESKEKLNEAESLWEKQIVEWLPRLVPATDYWVDRTALNKLAKYLEFRLKYFEAISLHKRHLALSEQELGAADDEVLNSFYQYIELLGHVWEYQTLISLMQMKLAELSLALGYENVKVITLWNRLNHWSVILVMSHPSLFNGDLQDSCWKALGACQKILSIGDNQITYAFRNLRILCSGKGEERRKLEIFARKNLIECERILGQESSATLAAISILVLELLASKSNEAEILCRKRLNISESSFGPESVQSLESIELLANVLHSQNGYDYIENREVSLLVSKFIHILKKKSDSGDITPRELETIQTMLWCLEPGFNSDLSEDSLKSIGHVVYIFDKVLSTQENQHSISEANKFLTWATRFMDISLSNQSAIFIELENLSRKVCNIAEKLGGSDSVLASDSFEELAKILSKKYSHKEAKSLFQKCILIKQNIFGSEHPVLVNLLENLGALLDQNHEYKEAESLYRQAILINQKNDITYNLALKFVYRRLAINLQYQGLIDDAIAIRFKLKDLILDMEGSNSVFTNIEYDEIASIWIATRKFSEAIIYLRNDLINAEEIEDIDLIMIILNNLAKIFLAKGEYKESEGLLLKCLNIEESLSSQDHLLQSRINLFNLYQAWRKPEEAAKYADAQ